MQSETESILPAIERHFHDVIRGRVGDLIGPFNVPLPRLAPLLDPTLAGEADDEIGWFPVPGMYGGFSYRFEDDRNPVKLIVESWSRVAGGSGQRHEITAEGSRLVAEGFV